MSEDANDISANEDKSSKKDVSKATSNSEGLDSLAVLNTSSSPDKTAVAAQAASSKKGKKEAKAHAKKKSKGTKHDSKHTGSHFAASENTAKADDAPKGQRSKKAAIVVGVIAGLLGAAYLGGAFFFSAHFLPNTTLDGIDVSLRSVDDLKGSLSHTLSNFEATITGDGINTTISGEDIDLTFDTAAYVDGALSQQNIWAWPLELAGNHAIKAKEYATYDADKLKALLAEPISAVNADATPTTDATISYNDTSASFEIVEEVYGTQIDEDAFDKAVGEKISKLETTIEIAEEGLIKPSVASDDKRLVAACDSANTYLGVSIDLTLAGTTTKTVDASLIKDWITLGDDFSVTLDTNKISSWTTGDLSAELDTAGTERTYTRPDGATCTVSGGSYGWVIDGAALATTLASQIESSNGSAIEIPTSQSAAVWTGKGQADWGNTYIDADLSAQYVRFYKGGELVWESSCVSGQTSSGHGTPTGVYQVNSNKTTNTTLVGLDEDNDGEPDYRTDVSYWIPFVGNLVAFHDASWRYTFGGTVYVYNGSHGCINLPANAAASLYNLADVGTPVLVHY